MGQGVATALGTLICCVVPLLAFGAGMYYARYGLPFAIAWRGFARRDHDEDDE